MSYKTVLISLFYPNRKNLKVSPSGARREMLGSCSHARYERLKSRHTLAQQCLRLFIYVGTPTQNTCEAVLYE